MNGNRIGFIGLGNMGGRMTSRLTGAGIDVVGFDTDREAASRWGATEAASIAAVVEAADVILMSLPDSKVVERVVLGENGVLAGCRDGQIVVDLSTAAASSTRRIAAALAARGVAYVDAGISGGAAAAENGTLTLMVGGDPAVIDRLGWVFAPIARKVVVMGGSGAGHTTKLLNNFLNAVSLAATAEVMVAGRKAGLDLHRLPGGAERVERRQFRDAEPFPEDRGRRLPGRRPDRQADDQGRRPLHRSPARARRRLPQRGGPDGELRPRHSARLRRRHLQPRRRRDRRRLRRRPAPRRNRHEN
ncbi:NAD(P)-dependent oxidoreductase [Methylobacterium oryzae CBMB20]